VSRTGRYKVLVMSGIAIMAIGLVLMHQLTATTEYPAMFLWMFVTGVGIGPTLSVFTIIVQNAVPFSMLGVATSNLTFFRQIGGTVGLAIAGTVFGNALLNRLPTEIVASLPPALQPQAQQMLSSGSGFNVNPNDLTGVGQSFGAAVAAQVPALQPLIPNLDQAFHQAMSLSIADTFVIGIITAGLAFIASLFMRELPLRATNSAPVATQGMEGAGADGGTPRFRESPVTD
jgi:hypothetical protein